MLTWLIEPSIVEVKQFGTLHSVLNLPSTASIVCSVSDQSITEMHELLIKCDFGLLDVV